MRSVGKGVSRRIVGGSSSIHFIRHPEPNTKVGKVVSMDLQVIAREMLLDTLPDLKMFLRDHLYDTYGDSK